MIEGLEAKLENREALIAVVGLGYVGLPLAVEFALQEFEVIAVDLDGTRVEQVNNGQNYIPDVRVGDLKTVVQRGSLRASVDYSEIGKADAVLICVPTPLDKNKQPDTGYIESAIERALPFIRKGQLFVLESTTYPGTTEEVLLPVLERSGMEVGKDVFLAFSPERVNPGDAVFKTRNTPKVVGGVTETCVRAAETLYTQIIEGGVHVVSSTRAAEMTKLLENTFRIVNISLVNELAQLCERMEIDVWEVIEASSTKPFGFMPFYPGPGLGGHCIPLDPFYLSWKAKEYDFSTQFIDLAGRINDAMPYYVIDQAAEVLNTAGKPLNGSRVMLLGMAYKKDVDDLRQSPALKIAHLLSDRRVLISYHDPLIPRVQEEGLDLHSVELTPETLGKQDLVLITTGHSNIDYDHVVAHAQLVFDTRNATKGIQSDKVVRLGAR